MRAPDNRMVRRSSRVMIGAVVAVSIASVTGAVCASSWVVSPAILIFGYCVVSALIVHEALGR